MAMPVQTSDDAPAAKRAAPQRSIEASLLDQAPAAIAVTDRVGKIVYWNKEAASVYGWSKVDAVGRDLLSLLARQADDADPLYDVFETLGAGRLWQGDLHLRRRDGSFLRVRARGRPLTSASGAHVGVMLVTVPENEGGPAGEPLAAQTEHDLVATGRRLALARREAGLTQGEVARRLGVTKRSLQGYEAGTVAPYRHLSGLESILGRDRSWFLATESLPGPRAVGRRELAEVVREVVRAEVLPILESARLRDDPHR
jgi:PAS domain S-box-containing protein